jgi:glc operon protein GlcG
MKSQVICTATIAILLAFGIGQPAHALDKAPILTLDLAKKMAAACEAKAKDMGWKMNVAIVDVGANEVFFERMDGAYLGSGDIARRKAETSAHFPFPTRGIEQLAYGKDLKGGTVPGLALVPGIIAFAGGLPVMTDDKMQIGAIGVSGGTADQDETCAQAGIDAVKDALK